MELISKYLLYLHIAAGFISLIIFWIPALNRKGSISHIRIGKIYVWTMGIVVVSAAIMSIRNFILGYTEIALFLGFLSLITGNPLWKGIAILNHKKGVSAGYLRIQLAFDALIFMSGLGLLIYGIYLGGKGVAILMIIFGILGVSNAGELWRQIKQPTKKVNWLIGHLEGMLTTGIAAYTAFFAFGGRQFLGEIFTGYWMIIPWVAPTVIGVVAIRFYKRRYMKKPSKHFVNTDDINTLQSHHG